jgi:hypothetical protein
MVFLSGGALSAKSVDEGGDMGTMDIRKRESGWGEGKFQISLDRS